jgi:hypothetical protein
MNGNEKKDYMRFGAVKPEVTPGQNWHTLIKRMCPTAPFNPGHAMMTLANYYVEKEVVQRLSPGEAEKILLAHNYDHNRRFDEAAARDLSHEIGAHHAINVCFARVRDGRPCIVNGQHTLWAIANSGESIPCCIRFYRCKDRKSLAELYAIFDSNKKRRTHDALAAAEGAGLVKYKLDPKLLADWGQAVTAAKNGFRNKNVRMLTERVKIASEDIVQEMAHFMESIIEVAQVTSRERRLLLPVGIRAGLYSAWLADQQKCHDFMMGYLTGADLPKGSPIVDLRQRVMDRKDRQHSYFLIDQHVGLFWTAWRTFCLGRKTRGIRVTLLANIPPYDQWDLAINIDAGTEKDAPEVEKASRRPASKILKKKRMVKKKAKRR